MSKYVYHLKYTHDPNRTQDDHEYNMMVEISIVDGDENHLGVAEHLSMMASILLSDIRREADARGMDFHRILEAILESSQEPAHQRISTQ